MQKWKDIPPKGGYQNLIQDYHEQLNRTRAQKQAQDESKDTSVNPSLFEETQEKTKRNFARMRMEILESIDTLELKFTSQFRQLSEIREVVDLERKALEDLYQIKIPSDSLAALASLKKERIAGFEQELEKKKKEFEDDCRRRKIELDMQEKTLDEHRDGFEKHIQDRESKFEESLLKKRIELSKLEQSIEEKHRAFTQAFDESQQKLQQEFNERHIVLDAEINKKQLDLGKIESDLQRKDELLKKELEAIKLKTEEVTILNRIEWAKEEEAYQAKKLELEKEFIQTKKKLEDEIQTREKQFWDSLAQEKQKWKQDEIQWEKKFSEQEKASSEKNLALQARLKSQYETSLSELRHQFEEELAAKNNELIELSQRNSEPIANKAEPQHKIVRPLKSSLSRKVSL